MVKVVCGESGVSGESGVCGEKGVSGVCGECGESVVKWYKVV